MMTNLFSIFDPATPNFLSTNWLASGLFLLLMPSIMWANLSRYPRPYFSLKKYLYSEFSPLMKKAPYLLIMSCSLFTIIMFNNLMGLSPYIFTPSSHMVFTMSLALPMWGALMLFGWLNNTANILAHLIPQGTPGLLMPFMVVIETISNLIRPGTLAIRLSANMIAGHLLIVLLSSATPVTPPLLGPLLLSAQITLTLLELAVAFIQAYVFSVLITLYAAESTN